MCKRFATDAFVDHMIGDVLPAVMRKANYIHKHPDEIYTRGAKAQLRATLARHHELIDEFSDDTHPTPYELVGCFHDLVQDLVGQNPFREMAADALARALRGLPKLMAHALGCDGDQGVQDALRFRREQVRQQRKQRRLLIARAGR